MTFPLKSRQTNYKYCTDSNCHSKEINNSKKTFQIIYKTNHYGNILIILPSTGSLIHIKNHQNANIKKYQKKFSLPLKIEVQQTL